MSVLIEPFLSRGPSPLPPLLPFSIAKSPISRFTSIGHHMSKNMIPVTPLMPVGNYSYQFFICCPRDCVSRHNGGTSRAPLKPLRVDSALSHCVFACRGDVSAKARRTERGGGRSSGASAFGNLPLGDCR